MKAFVVAISGLLISTGALAQAGPGPGGYTQSETTATPDDDQRAENGSDGNQTAPREICRRVETATGSRMSYRRLCMTAQQWRSFNRSDR